MPISETTTLKAHEARRAKGQATRQRIYRFIVEYMTAHAGLPPTVREIGKGVGLASHNTVFIHLSELADENKIAFYSEFSQARNYYLPGSVWTPPNHG